MGKQTKKRTPAEQRAYDAGRGPGRPRINAPDMTVRKAIRMTPAQEEDWCARAATDHRSFSEWARVAIERACEEGLV